MKNHWMIIAGALRAAVWKAKPIRGSAPIHVAVIWAIVAIAAELTQQYVQSRNSGYFNPYGLNSTLASMAIAAAVVVLFTSAHRALVLATVFALNTLLSSAGVAAELLAAAVQWQTPPFVIILRFLLVSIWWIGAFAAVLRSVEFQFRRGAVARAAGAYLASSVAIALLPVSPMFADSDFDYRASNVWEWTRTWWEKPAEPSPGVDVAKLELSQGALLDAEIKKLLPEKKGTADIYAIGMAAWSGQDVFARELEGALAALEQAIPMDRGVVRLVNHLDTTERAPIASRTNFAAAVHYVAEIMNRDEDVLLVFITSHGSQTGVGLQLTGAMQVILTPDDVASVLAREGIKNRIVIVSACYSGIFLKPLISPDSIVITAADADNPSFGCSNERDWTYFGDAFFNLSLKPGASLEKAFDDAKVVISEWEARDNVPPSNPQAHFGLSLSEKLAAKIDRRASAAPAPAIEGR